MRLDEALWCMLFVDGKLLVDTIREMVRVSCIYGRGVIESGKNMEVRRNWRRRGDVRLVMGWEKEETHQSCRVLRREL